MLDMSMVLNDPLISDLFDVRRNAETVGDNGRATKTPELIKDVRGTVNPQDPTELQRRDDGQIASHAILVHTQFALRDARFGYQPDVVIWDGIEWLVVKAISWRRMAGYTEALCTSTRATDKPQ